MFVNKDSFEEIKKQNDSVTLLLKRILKIEADKIVKSEPIVYANNVNNIDTGRTIQGQIVNLVIAYRLYGDERYLERAKKRSVTCY